MRVDAFDKPGGDLLLVQQYIQAVRNAGVTPDQDFYGEVIVDLDADLSGFDVIHLTNIDRPVETHQFFLAAQAAGKPVVISPIHHSHREMERYEREGRRGAIRFISKILSFRGFQYFRSIVHSIQHRELIRPTFKTFLKGMRRSQVAVLQGVDRVLVLADKERADILADFGVVTDERFFRVRIGFEPTPSAAGVSRDNDVCVVGRIESRKNQIAILDALEKLGLKGIFAGRENPNQQTFCTEFKQKILRSKSEFTGGLTPEEVVDLMRRSKVHVSASWFEASSLVDIEAYFAGCAVVSSIGGATREILGESAQYVDPGESASIQRGITAALASRSLQGDNLSRIDKSVTESWEQIGSQLAQIYRGLLHKD
jgi:glycosyltransferase involved in cell wall biosynthesis